MKKGYFTKYIIIPIAAAIGITGLSMLSVNTYKKSKAGDLIERAESQMTRLEKSIGEASEWAKGSGFLMTSEKEKSGLKDEISDSQNKHAAIKERIELNKKEFEDGEYDTVRSRMDPEFGLEEGQKRETLFDLLNEEQNDIDKVIMYCKETIKFRQDAIRNDQVLEARLKKPYISDVVELPSEVAALPKDLHGSVPAVMPDMKSRLKALPKELNNSLGLNVLKHQPLLDHILKNAKTEEIKAKAQRMYDTALEAYMQVMPKNDALPMWYKADKHDGKLSKKDYKALLKSQKEVLELLAKGDLQLNSLRAYFEELNEQHYVFVSAHSHTDKTFTETDLEYKCNFEGECGMKLVTNHVPGHEYFYTLTTVTPAGRKDQRVKVGEKKGKMPQWNYQRNEQVGWVREWKRPGYDNTHIKSGWAKDLNPKIEEPFCTERY